MSQEDKLEINLSATVAGLLNRVEMLLAKNDTLTKNLDDLQYRYLRACQANTLLSTRIEELSRDLRSYREKYLDIVAGRSSEEVDMEMQESEVKDGR